MRSAHVDAHRYRSDGTNQVVPQWGAVFGDEVLAAAILDRLLHHSHSLMIQGESYPISVLRAVTSGESANAAMYGYFDTPRCLASRRSCAPDVETQDPLLERDFTEPQELNGYRFEFFDGPPLRPTANVPRSASAMTRYAVVAVPVATQSRHRCFCTDDRQTIYVTDTESIPFVENGRCVDETNPLH